MKISGVRVASLAVLLGTSATIVSPLSAQAEEGGQVGAPEGESKNIEVAWTPTPSISTKDGQFEFKVFGRLQADAGWLDEDDSGLNIDESEIRAARIGFKGKVIGHYRYKVEVDFANDEVVVKDANLKFYLGEKAEIKLGQFKTPNSLDEQTSGRFTSLMERGSFTDAFGLARRIGVGVEFSGDDWTTAFGVFHGDTQEGLDGQGYEVAGRATYSPVTGETRWHLGGSVRLRDAGDRPNFKYKQRPHLHLSPTKYVSTGSVGEKDTFVGLEVAAIQGSLWAASEYAWLKANETAAPSDPTFGGGYIEVGYYLTGETRNYKPSSGAWKRTKPSRPLGQGAGAWALVARYDTLDLSDKTWYGGEQDSVILGLDWYPTSHARISLNYNHTEVSNAFNVAANGLDGDNEITGWGLRGQFDF